MWAFLFKMAKTYYEKLKDPKWQKLRLQVLERDNWACSICQSKSNTLNVHHKKYAKSGNPWDVDLKYLITYCESCHKKYEDNKKEILEALIECDYFYNLSNFDFKLEDLIRMIYLRPEYGEIIETMLSQIDSHITEAYEIGRSYN